MDFFFVNDLKAEPHVFDVEELERHVIHESQSLTCPTCQTPVNLQILVPDLKMVFFHGRKAEFSEIELGGELGRGGFATVFKGFQGSDL